MKFKEYFEEIIKEVEGFNFATEAYIKLLYNEHISIDRAIDAIKKGSEL